MTYYSISLLPWTAKFLKTEFIPYLPVSLYRHSWQLHTPHPTEAAVVSVADNSSLLYQIVNSQFSSHWLFSSFWPSWSLCVRHFLFIWLLRHNCHLILLLLHCLQLLLLISFAGSSSSPEPLDTEELQGTILTLSSSLPIFTLLVISSSLRALNTIYMLTNAKFTSWTRASSSECQILISSCLFWIST